MMLPPRRDRVTKPSREDIPVALSDRCPEMAGFSTILGTGNGTSAKRFKDSAN
jgi:hypothetical protein